MIRTRTISACALRLAIFALAGIVAGCSAISPPEPQIPVTSPWAHPVVATARSQTGAPYKWGGTSPETGFDCSGLAVWSYGRHGIGLPRTSWDQYKLAGSPVARKDLKSGDLVFFRIPGQRKSLHVGIVTDRWSFVHSPSTGGHVREDSLEHVYYRKVYLGAKRVTGAAYSPLSRNK